ncbi:MAG: GH25 family lysozyme, partial [Christensenella sp.]
LEIGDGKWYMGSDGIHVTGWNLIDGKWYYMNPFRVARGLLGIDGELYFFNKDGDAAVNMPFLLGGVSKVTNEKGLISSKDFTGRIVIGGKEFFATTNTIGAGWVSEGTELLYCVNTGEIAKGMNNINGKMYYFTTDKGYYVAAPVINSVNVSGTLVTVTATKSKHASSLQYSFDAGVTWQNENSKSFREGSVIPANTIIVKDNFGNLTYYSYEISMRKISNGIDVSAFQGNIDWKAVAASGVEFAVIRAVHWPKGGSYYQIDPYFYQNVINAKANGIKVGAYIFSYAQSTAEAAQEAMFFVNSNEAKSLKNAGIKFDLPIYFDYESRQVVDQDITSTERANILRYGMTTLDQNGYYPGFYTYYDMALKIDTDQLIKEGYAFWVAHFSASVNPWRGAGMWQHSSKGTVPGISGNVDLDYMYFDYPSIINPGGGKIPYPVASTLTVYDVNTNKVITAPYDEILAGVVQNEVGGGCGLSGGDAFKLFQAQAVAAHSWITYQHNNGNGAPKVGLKAPSDAVKNAVNSVKNYRIFYGAEIANAAYGSAAAPTTNSSVNMWGSNLPYLTNVASYDDQAYTNWQGRTRVLGINYFKNPETGYVSNDHGMQSNIDKILKRSNATAGLSPDQWLKDPQYDGFGYLTSISVCNTVVKGGYFYDNCWGLLSPNCTISFSNNEWTLVTRGNGHGVGMSQNGAAAMIGKEGKTWQEVLLHYYPGTRIM